NAIRQGFNDYGGNHFQNADDNAGAAYAKSVAWGDRWNAIKSGVDMGGDTLETGGSRLLPSTHGTKSGVERYSRAQWGDVNSPEAQAFMSNFRQAFGSYPQHLDLDLLHPLAPDGSIPSGRDVSLFVGKNGEVLVYAKPPAPNGTGAFRGIHGLDGA